MSEQQPPVAAVPESTNGHSHEHENGDERAAKRARIDEPAASEPQNGTATTESSAAPPTDSRDRRSGLVAIKKEFLVDTSAFAKPARDNDDANDDDAAEGRGHSERGGDDRDKPFQGKKGKKKGKGGQNIERSFGKFDDALPLCNSRAFYNEFSPRECRFGDKCRMCHDIRKYLAEGRRPDVETFDGKCPVFAEHGYCPSGWKCRFVRSHMEEVEREDGRKELVLLDKSSPADATGEQDKSRDAEEVRLGIHNVVAMDVKIDLNRKRTDFSKADEYIKWLDSEATRNHDLHHMRKEDEGKQTLEDIKATFVDPPFKPSEKRRLYFGPETPTLAPLTTQGNLPYRRLCVELGAQLTYSEMAFGLPLVQGTKADWTLMKAHSSELSPPKFDGAASKTFVFDNYVPETDLKFGAQISGSAHWVTTKAANILARTCPKLRVIDLNCGCPIDMVFKSGGGSALLDAHGKLERMIRGMNAVSGEIPITAKIRMGVKSSRPNAPSVIERLAFGAKEHRERLGAPGCAAVTLHGRSREQRYTKLADWSYIGECAALIKRYNETKDALTDTAGEPDPSTQPNGGHMYFLGNGDCYSHEDYYNAIDNARVDSVMIGRGALVKPWLFEEIEKRQYLDKSASQRLEYIEKFTRYGLEAWGSDELGIGFTRRFLLEWLSFAHRYVPIAMLEHLPPKLNERPPAYHGRNDLETLMASDSYTDWIKLSEMFLGPVHPGFQFKPKHKSNAYEAEG